MPRFRCCFDAVAHMAQFTLQQLGILRGVVTRNVAMGCLVSPRLALRR